MTDPSSVMRQLPILPHPDHLRKQAKVRLVMLKLGTPDCRLADAQRALAHEYGFATWAALQAEVSRRASTPVARQIRTRRRDADSRPRKTSGHSVDVPSTCLSARRRRRAFLAHLEEERLPPAVFLRAGILVQVCFAVAALIGIGVVCVALAGHGSVVIPSELPHNVI